MFILNKDVNEDGVQETVFLFYSKEEADKSFDLEFEGPKQYVRDSEFGEIQANIYSGVGPTKLDRNKPEDYQYILKGYSYYYTISVQY